MTQTEIKYFSGNVDWEKEPQMKKCVVSHMPPTFH